MGGYGSGRFGRRLTIGECLRIEFPYIKSKGYFEDNGRSGTLSWTKRGEKSGEIAIQSVIYPEKGIGELILTYSINNEPQKQRIALEGKPMRFGGFTYYAICPKSWNKCRTLVFSPPLKKFISVKSSGYLYTSQTENQLDRIRRQRDKAEIKYNKMSKYARNKTKDKLRSRYFGLEYQWNERFQQMMGIMQGRIDKLTHKINKRNKLV